MSSDKQEQRADGGSTAIQARGDIHIHQGMSVTEVKELCQLFLRENFPKLQEQARRAAEANVREFAEKLEAQIVANIQSVVIEKFTNPDVQAAINDAVQASARKGSAANPDVLSALIVERAGAQSSDYTNMVISEAVTVVPKLTQPQIALITAIHFAMSVKINNVASLAGVEPYARVVLQNCQQGFHLSDSQRNHIQYAGAGYINRIMSVDVYTGWQKELYDYLQIPDVAEFKRKLNEEAPSAAILLEQFTKENWGTLTLTSVGQAIAIANLSRHLGKLNYAIWLK